MTNCVHCCMCREYMWTNDPLEATETIVCTGCRVDSPSIDKAADEPVRRLFVVVLGGKASSGLRLEQIYADSPVDAVNIMLGIPGLYSDMEDVYRCYDCSEGYEILVTEIRT